MWIHHFKRKVSLSPEALWDTLARVAEWPHLDHNIEYLTIDEPPAAGVPFTLKPKGGPKLRFTIGHFDAPTLYSDVCQMPLAKMHTKHTLKADQEGTLIEIEIKIEGPLSGLWGLAVGRKHAAGLPAQTDRFVQGAKSRTKHA